MERERNDFIGPLKPRDLTRPHLYARPGTQTTGALETKTFGETGSVLTKLHGVLIPKLPRTSDRSSFVDLTHISSLHCKNTVKRTSTGNTSSPESFYLVSRLQNNCVVLPLVQRSAPQCVAPNDYWLDWRAPDSRNFERLFRTLEIGIGRWDYLLITHWSALHFLWFPLSWYCTYETMTYLMEQYLLC